MAPARSTTIIDLCDSDDEGPTQSAQTRPNGQSAANQPRKPKATMVPPSNSSSSTRPSNGSSEQMRVSTQKDQSQPSSKARELLSNSNGQRFSGSKTSTKLSDAAQNSAKTRATLDNATQTSTSGADKHKAQGRTSALNASKDTQDSDDSDDELPPVSSLVSPHALRKGFVTGERQRDQSQPDPKSPIAMKIGGTKRSRDDNGSALGPWRKRQRQDIRNDATSVSSSSDSGTRHTSRRPADTPPARNDRAKPPRKTQPGPTVDLITPTKGSRDVMTISSDDDEEPEKHSAPQRNDPRSDNTSGVNPRKESAPRTSDSTLNLQKRLAKTTNGAPSSTVRSSIIENKSRDSTALADQSRSALGTSGSAKGSQQGNASSNKQHVAAALPKDDSACSIDTNPKPTHGRILEASGGVTEESRIVEEVSSSLDVQRTSGDETPKVSKSTRATGGNGHKMPRNGNTSTPRKSASDGQGLRAVSSGEQRLVEPKQASHERSGSAGVDQGYASLDSSNEAVKDLSKTTVSKSIDPGTVGNASSPDEAAQRGTAPTGASAGETEGTHPVVANTATAMSKTRPDVQKDARTFDVDRDPTGTKKPATSQNSSTPVIFSSGPEKLAVAAPAPTDNSNRLYDAEASEQLGVQGAPALVVDAVARDPAGATTNPLRDSASPLGRPAQVAPENGGHSGHGEMNANDGEGEDAENQRARATPTSEARGDGKPNVTFSALGLSKQVEHVLGKYLEELRGDNEYWSKTWMKRARLSVESPKGSGSGPTAASAEKPYSFADYKPLQLRPPDKLTNTQKTTKFTVEKMATSSSKSTKSVLTVPVTPFGKKDRMPNYSHAVGIKANFLAANVTSLQYWPYFGDNFDFAEAESLKEQYNLDIHDRPRKLLRLMQAQNLEPYVEDVLRELGLVWDDILRFLLEADPDVGSKSDAQQALKMRYESCSEDFSRNHERAAFVLSSLRPSSSERLAKAAILCENFVKMAWISLWHLARRHQLEAVPSKDDDGTADLLEQMTCRICLRFDCPYHGELTEHEDSEDEASTESGVDKAVMTDIINPPKVNYRTRVAFSKPVDLHAEAELDPLAKKDRRTLSYWQHKGFKHEADVRGPFYPCHHPGTSCEEAECSCYNLDVPCEKTCTCAYSECTRKYMGCNCSNEKARKGRKLVCFEDDRCACFTLGRECDPDLCGSCGVCDVVDPVNRYNDQIGLGRCRNASLQRGVPKRTLLGDSGIHGFGLYAGEDIKAHQFVGEYKGEVITKEEAERRGAVYEFQHLSYLFSLNEKQEIDSTYFGNKIRFINHAGNGEHNLYPRIFFVNSVHRIALCADKTIKKGEELLFNYGPKFPDEQLGGKSVPRVRNSDHVHQDFWDVEHEVDELGNRRARKAVKPKGRPRKSGNVESVGTPKKRGGPRPGAGRKSRKSAPEPVVEEEEEQELGVATSAEARLAAFNISDEMPEDAMDVDAYAGAEDDDVFEPGESGDDASEASDVEEVEDDEEGEMTGGRFRRARGRPVAGRRAL